HREVEAHLFFPVAQHAIATCWERERATHAVGARPMWLPHGSGASVQVWHVKVLAQLSRVRGSRPRLRRSASSSRSRCAASAGLSLSTSSTSLGDCSPTHPTPRARHPSPRGGATPYRARS